MGRLIIDGKSVFEIDEECLKKRKIPHECGIDKYLVKEEKSLQHHEDKKEDR